MPPPTWTGTLHPFHNVSDLAKIYRFSAHGAVEIHYVDSAGSEAFPHAGLRTGVFIEDRRGFHLPWRSRTHFPSLRSIAGIIIIGSWFGRNKKAPIRGLFILTLSSCYSTGR